MRIFILIVGMLLLFSESSIAKNIFSLSALDSLNEMESSLRLRIQKDQNRYSFKLTEYGATGVLVLEGNKLQSLIVSFSDTIHYRDVKELQGKNFFKVKMNEGTDVIDGSVHVGDASRGRIWKISQDGHIEKFYLVEPWKSKEAVTSVEVLQKHAAEPRPVKVP